MKNLTYSNKFYLNPSDTALGSLVINIDIEMPDEYSDKEILANIQKQITAKIFGEKFTTLQIDSLIPNYVEKLHQNFLLDYDANFQNQVKKADGPSMMNEINIDGIAIFLDNKILSYSNESYAYLGGAHGNSIRILYNFDLSNAQAITESNIFIADYQTPLTQLIKEQILEQSAEIGSVADLSELDFWEDKIAPNDNFYVSDEGLVYIYNPYDIAPYSMGQIEVSLPYAKLKPLLKPGNVIEYLYSNSTLK